MNFSQYPFRQTVTAARYIRRRLTIGPRPFGPGYGLEACRIFADLAQAGAADGCAGYRAEDDQRSGLGQQ